ncbi:OLC1v1037929C1 [Oldenlandia corymbosa var. corymbosa]|uniref:OLC1v1037929C1 n=1 Tax=Oldenlandia corymbosa var. corymbosa TaxID=529605 RepID=A0AAV1CZ74_OLDCO|nr:OLC1v1037929C1 [Oldenlandia corymbosa var. corymbosa]
MGDDGASENLEDCVRKLHSAFEKLKELLEAAEKESHKTKKLKKTNKKRGLKTSRRLQKATDDDDEANHELALVVLENNNTCSPKSISPASVSGTPPNNLLLKSCLRRKRKVPAGEDVKREPLNKKVRFDNEGKPVRIIEIPAKNAGRKP